jgi:CRISPR/Cas system-associated exonuclease Cas4 (RecB family)
MPAADGSALALSVAVETTTTADGSSVALSGMVEMVALALSVMVEMSTDAGISRSARATSLKRGGLRA